MEIHGNEPDVSVFYSPTHNSKNSFTNDFEKVEHNFPKATPFLLCEDVNTPKTDLDTVKSSDDYEQSIVDLFNKKFLKQAVELNTSLTCLMLNSIDIVLAMLRKTIWFLKSMVFQITMQIKF